MIDYTKIRESWIIFREGDAWHQRFLKNGFGHASILTRDEFNWILIEPEFSRLEVEILPYKVDMDVPKQYKMHDDKLTILKVVSATSTKRRTFRGLSMIGCVSIVKYYLSIPGFAFTPYGLYKRLLKLGSKNKYGICSVKIIE